MYSAVSGLPARNRSGDWRVLKTATASRGRCGWALTPASPSGDVGDLEVSTATTSRSSLPFTLSRSSLTFALSHSGLLSLLLMPGTELQGQGQIHSEGSRITAVRSQTVEQSEAQSILDSQLKKEQQRLMCDGGVVDRAPKRQSPLVSRSCPWQDFLALLLHY